VGACRCRRDWVGVEIADPLIGLVITLVILRITWHSWRTIRVR
jgi:Co/Zn/Cd efflux system component